MGRAKFDPKEIDPFAWMIGEKVRIGTIKAGSVGFRPVKVEIPEEEDGKAPKGDKIRLIYRKQELYEFSACNIPANPQAMVQESAPADVRGIAWTHDGKGYRQQAKPEAVIDIPAPQGRMEMLAVEVAPEAEAEIECAAIPYKDHGNAPEGDAWDAAAETRDATPEQLKMMCAWFDAEAPDLKGSYKLPHHQRESKKAVWRGVSAAMGALMGGRGGVDIPDGDRKGTYNHLAKHYKDFEKEPPEFRSGLSLLAEELSKRFDALADSLKRAIEGIGVAEPRKAPAYLDGLLKERGARRPSALDNLVTREFSGDGKHPA